MNKLLTAESISMILAKSRESCNKSQKYMSKALQRSIGTVQNWEYGYSMPNIIEFIEWFEILGINPLKYVLDFLHPDEYTGLSPRCSTEIVRDSLIKWVSELASDADIRKIAYSIYGGTGSSWTGQVDMICALNHLPIMDRINIAENIYNLYTLRDVLGELRNPENVRPDMENLSACIMRCKEAVMYRKTDYFN